MTFAWFSLEQSPWEYDLVAAAGTLLGLFPKKSGSNQNDSSAIPAGAGAVTAMSMTARAPMRQGWPSWVFSILRE